jgi:hypothetical protein
MPADAASAARRRNGSRWLLVVGVALGAIFGVAISTFWHRDADQRPSHDSANHERKAAPVAATANTHESAAMARVRALETRLLTLESQRNQDAATKPTPREPLSPEQGRMLVRAEVDRVRREAQFSINCVRTVLGPTPEQMVSGGKNRGQVLFDCTDARAEAR